MTSKGYVACGLWLASPHWGCFFDTNMVKIGYPFVLFKEVLMHQNTFIDLLEEIRPAIQILTRQPQTQILVIGLPIKDLPDNIIKSPNLQFWETRDVKAKTDLPKDTVLILTTKFMSHSISRQIEILKHKCSEDVVTRHCVPFGHIKEVLQYVAKIEHQPISGGALQAA